jgi:hypothetical protein
LPAIASFAAISFSAIILTVSGVFAPLSVSQWR